ncbi:MAG: hypothetical protein ACR2QM_00680 [Longimicrobiales bacterium]
MTPIERWFVRRGVPHFIKGYSATEDVLTRAAPFLTLVFLLSAVSAIDLDWPVWGMVLAILGGLLILLGAWAALNELRGRPRWSLPTRIGATEITIFLAVPTLLPLLFGGDLSGAGLTLLTLAGILVLAYLATSYGLVAVLLWAFGQLLHTVGETLRLFARSLPLLLLGFMFLFINAEAWQAAGRLDQALLAAAIILFAVLAAVFLLTQIPRELAGLNTFASTAEAAELADGAPVEAVSPDSLSPPPLTRRENGNLWIVVFVSQAFRLVAVSALVGAFFVGLGLLIIRPDTIRLWIEQDPNVWWSFPLFGQQIELTRELLQVSSFLAAFAAVYFSVYTTTDATLRAEFFEGTVAEVRQNLAARALYRGEE